MRERSGFRVILTTFPNEGQLTMAFKAFVLGLVVGAAGAAPLAYNQGRGAPLLSNPFAERTLGTAVKEKAQELRDDTRDKIKELTK